MLARTVNFGSANPPVLAIEHAVSVPVQRCATVGLRRRIKKPVNIAGADAVCEGMALFVAVIGLGGRGEHSQ